MRFKTISFLFAAAALTLAACGHKGADSNASDSSSVDLESHSFNIIASSTLADADTTGGANLLLASCTAQIPRKIDGHDVDALRDSLLKMAGMQLDKSGRATAVADTLWTITKLNPDSTDACNYSISELVITLLQPRVIVWQCTSSYYDCGAAHPMTATSTLNYSRKDNSIIRLDELIKPGSRPALARLIQSKLKDNKDLYVAVKQVAVPSQFAVLDNGLSFTYPLYSIAPYSSGEIVVTLDATDLMDILSPRGQEIIFGNLPD